MRFFLTVFKVFFVESHNLTVQFPTVIEDFDRRIFIFPQTHRRSFGCSQALGCRHCEQEQKWVHHRFPVPNFNRGLRRNGSIGRLSSSHGDADVLAVRRDTTARHATRNRGSRTIPGRVRPVRRDTIARYAIRNRGSRTIRGRVRLVR
jgi:hypothetical protein